jgi:3-hydroxymyristoyl/3-hydroxydecanoyl-(acyl carrier protein) dehydratases
MNREELKQFIPHREPMLLIDEASVDENGTAHGTYTVIGTEYFLQGHFPGNPIVPGVIQCEMAAQTCCVLLGEKTKGKTPVFTGIDKVKFKRQVKPGETIAFECVLTRELAPFYFAKIKGSVNGQLCVSGEFSFALIG